VSPVVADSTVYFGDSLNLYAVDTSDGSVQWRFERSPTDSSQVINDGTVYFAANKRNKATVYAVDAADGTQQWGFETDGLITTSPAVANDTIYVGSNDQNVYALDARSGTEQWRFEADEKVGAVGVESDTVYVGSNGIYTLDASNGDQRWQGGAFNPAAYVVDSLAVNGGTVYYTAGERVATLRGTDGSIEWGFEMPGRFELLPTAESGTLYIGGHKFVRALDPADGTTSWRFWTGLGTSLPSVTSDTIYVGDHDHNVWGIAAADGTKRWHFRMNGEATSPAVGNNAVYVGSKEGKLYALNEK
jgi:outer membrane protein assembly factor BamB